MDVAAQLRVLRASAGNPSYRTLERLISRQGRQQKMARSTIQEKFSGASSVTLPQALSLVEALAECARLNNITLPAKEVDQEAWRQKIVAATTSRISPTQQTQPVKVADRRNITFDTEPLRQAEMHDLVDLVLNNSGNPPATWLSAVIRGMLNAEMTVTDFLEKASQDSPSSVVQTLRALENEFPHRLESDLPWEQGNVNPENTATVGSLLTLAARQHGVDASPAILVGLRRSSLNHHAETFLTRVATWHLARNIEKVANHLAAASLSNDTERLMKAVGGRRQASRVAEVVHHFAKLNRQIEIDNIYAGIGTSDKYRIRLIVKSLIDKNCPRDQLAKIAGQIEYGKHEEYAQHMDESGLADFAEMVRTLVDTPPF